MGVTLCEIAFQRDFGNERLVRFESSLEHMCGHPIVAMHAYMSKNKEIYVPA